VSLIAKWDMLPKLDASRAALHQWRHRHLDWVRRDGHFLPSRTAATAILRLPHQRTSYPRNMGSPHSASTPGLGSPSAAVGVGDGERRAAYDRVLATLGRPGARVLVVGEPGIGKSHLVDHVLQAMPEDRLVLFTRATEYDQGRFRGLRDLLQDVPEDRMATLPVVERNALLGVLERTRQDTPVEPGLIQASVTHLFADLAREGAVVVIDDWQWLDEDTSRVLRQASERPLVRRAMSVLAARRTDGSPEDFGIRSVFAPTDVIAVPPLRAPALRALLHDTFGRRLPDDEREAVLQHSSGNPLWALELAAARLEGDPRNAPMTVTDAMRGRITAMPAPLRAVLELVTVLGRASESCLVGAGVTEPTTLDLAVRQRVLQIVDDDVTVAHPLLGAAAVGLLNDDEQRAVHRRAAALPIDPVQRAAHSDSASRPGPDEDLAEELTVASRRAVMSGASDTAYRLARRALTRTPRSSAAWSNRVMAAAAAAFVCGRLAEVVALLDQIDPTTLPIDQFDSGVVLMADAMQRVHGRTRVLQRVHELQDQLPLHGPKWDVVEVVRLTFVGLEERDVVEQLAVLLDRLDPQTTPHAVYAAVEARIIHQVDRGDGLDPELLRQQRDFERVTPIEVGREDADDLEAMLAYQCDDLVRSRWRLPAALRRSRDVGDVNRIAAGLGHSVTIAVLTGALPAASEFHRQAEEAAEALVDAPSALHRARGLLALALDDRAGLSAVLESALPPAMEARGDLLKSGLVGLDAAYSNDWEAAVVPLERVYQSSGARGIREPGRRLWVDVELGRALVHTGQVARARRIASALAVLGGRPDRVHARGQAHRLAGLIALREGDAGTAATAFERALVDLRAGGFVLERLRAETERIGALLTLGRQRDARALHAEALLEAEKVGEPRIIRDLVALSAVVAGDDMRSRLTGAEYRVAAAVADGKSNREIANEFFLSVRTVEAQLASVYRKTGARTRTQLALRIREEKD
jgi:DNA-binding CsgD family transcriptional regulator